MMEEKVFSVITLGSYGAGKTSLLLKAINPSLQISVSYICTLGVDFKTKEHVYKDQKYKLRIWDTAGQEKFQHINRLYYKDVDAVLLVYDIGCLESFHILDKFYKDFVDNSVANGVFLLVGTKCDTLDRQVSKSLASQRAESWRMPHVECSAFSGENVEKLFDILLAQLLKVKRQRYRPQSIALQPSPVIEKKGCIC